jgi:hypothetical protein
MGNLWFVQKLVLSTCYQDECGTTTGLEAVIAEYNSGVKKTNSNLHGADITESK